MKTKVEDTQKLLNYIDVAAPQLTSYQPQRTDPLAQFLQQKALENESQGMLTSAELLKRFPY